MQTKRRLLNTLSIIIPIYNNEKTAIAQIKACEKVTKRITTTYEIILCDDGSTDNTRLLLQKRFKKNMHMKLVFHQQNWGIARTIKSLYFMAQYEYLMTFSVDGDWEARDLYRIAKKTAITHADIVIGKRNHTNYTTSRKIVSFFYNFIPLLLFGVQTIDAGSNKIVKCAILKNMEITSRSTFFEAEIIIRAKKMGYKVSCVPIHYQKIDRRSGKSVTFKSVFTSLVDAVYLRMKIKNIMSQQVSIGQ